MKCRHCRSELGTVFLDLGAAPPSNAYLTPEEARGPETWLPLRLLVCERCWLVQTEDFAGREALFTREYAYFSSVSSTWLDHARAFVAESVERFGLTEGSRVVEVAANDGYLLRFVKERGIPCLGIEPTASTAAAARARGIEIVEEFFGRALAHRLREAGLEADLLVANNVLAHVPDLEDFVGGFPILLRANGVATFEFPHLERMIESVQFDTAYHEHFSYFSFTTARAVLEHAGLRVIDVRELPTHGGSLRVYAVRDDTSSVAPTPAVAALLRREADAGVTTADHYRGFQGAAERVKRDLLRFLVTAREGGRKVGAYGAAAKGNTLLNFAGVRPDLLPYVVDRATSKQGRLLPGSRIPIVAEDHLRRDRPDHILVLPWNLEAEIVEQLAYTAEWGAEFVFAVPALRSIAAGDGFASAVPAGGPPATGPLSATPADPPSLA